MYRVEYRKPGCLLWAVFFVVASFVAAFPVGLLRFAFPDIGLWSYPAFLVLLMWRRSRPPSCPPLGRGLRWRMAARLA